MRRTDTKATEPDVPPAAGGTQVVKSAARTVELLECLAQERGKRSLSELHADLGYPKSSLYVLLQTLVRLGWVETDRTGTLYGLGARALLVGTSFLDGDEMVKLTAGVLDRLAQQTTETVHLARLDGPDVVYLATRDSEHYLRPFARVGRRLPAHSTALGKALLAARDDDTVRALLPDTLAPLTAHTLVDKDALLADLAETRRRGYAAEREENTVGLACFAVELRTREPATDAISCSIPVARLDPERSATIVAALLTGRSDIEAAVRGAR
jgi:IclR family acetate operon transcriptional repressor